MFIIYLKEENILKLITVYDKTGIKMGILILESDKLNFYINCGYFVAVIKVPKMKYKF